MWPFKKKLSTPDQPVERLQHVCHTEIQFKHSPATRLAMLREKWRRMSDSDVLGEVQAMTEDFARGGSDGSAFHFQRIMKECRIKFARTKIVRCHKCDEEITVVP